MAKKVTQVKMGHPPPFRLLRSKRFLGIVLPLSFIFTLLNCFAIYFPFIEPEQKAIVSSTNIKKWFDKTLFNHAMDDPDFVKNNFLLINVTHDMALSCKEPFPNFYANKDNPNPCNPIVDRKRLISLLTWLNNHPEHFEMVVCDLLFEKTKNASLDSGLVKCLHDLESQHKILFASVYDKHNNEYYGDLVDGVANKMNKGAVNEEKVEDYFFKYRLTYEKTAVKSLPLLMYERINKDTVSTGLLGMLRYHNKKGRKIRAHNTFIPEMVISTDDIDKLLTPAGNNNGQAFRVDSNVAYMELWQAVKRGQNIDNIYLTQTLSAKSAHKRIVFIGAFSHDHSDMHKTLYGDMDGALILLNIYHNLDAGSNRVNLIYHILIFLSFLLLFRILFIKILWFKKYESGWRKGLSEWFIKQSPYIILVAMTLVANIFFGQVTNVIILLLFIGIIKIIKKWTNDWSFITWPDYA